MSERNKPHNGRDLTGNFKVRQLDVEDLESSPDGADYVRDDVRLGGAIEDTGPEAIRRAERISRLVTENRENVEKSVNPDREMS